MAAGNIHCLLRHVRQTRHRQLTDRLRRAPVRGCSKDQPGGYKRFHCPAEIP
ncbi:MAG: hypothetical protein MZV64_60245 [Ignavibacteriales bacterium]|nr:hypothetical protein [Ignavibacteriales bacterium]